MSEATTVLLIEDNRAEADLIEGMCFDTDGPPFEVVRAACLSEGLARIGEGGVGLVLLDLSLPDNRRLERFSELKGRAGGVPIVVLTCMDDELLAVEAVKAGAQDYLVKDQVDGRTLRRCMRYALERGQAEAKLSDALAQIDKGNPTVEMRTTSGDLAGCHLLFIPRAEAAALPVWLARTANRPLLTVSDIAGFARGGGMVELPLEGSRIGIVVNRRAALARGFEFNAQLLRLARVVEP